jgi:hypothetical protein
MRNATSKPWGSVVALAGLSSNCPAPTCWAACHPEASGDLNASDRVLLLVP